MSYSEYMTYRWLDAAIGAGVFLLFALVSPLVRSVASVVKDKRNARKEEDL
jgi:hypothetical protein